MNGILKKLFVIICLIMSIGVGGSVGWLVLRGGQIGTQMYATSLQVQMRLSSIEDKLDISGIKHSIGTQIDRVTGRRGYGTGLATTQTPQSDTPKKQPLTPEEVSARVERAHTIVWILAIIAGLMVCVRTCV